MTDVEPAAGPKSGTISDTLPGTVVTLTMANASIPFGGLVFGGPTNPTCYAQGTYGGGGCLGVAVRNSGASPADGIAFVEPETIAILIRGAVWVRVPSGCGFGEPAYYDQSGNLTPVATRNTAILNGSFTTGCEPGGMAILKLT